MDKDTAYIRRVNDLALESIRSGGGPFGALIVKNGNIIAEAINSVVKDADPTAHAEIMAIRIAAEKTGSHILDGCILFTSCEPCPMCLGAIYWAGIKKVVYSSDRKDAAGAGFNDSFIYDEIFLTPPERKIIFLQLTDNLSKEVFLKWEQYQNKIPY